MEKELFHSITIRVQRLPVDIEFYSVCPFENQQIFSTIANDERREQPRRENAKEHASTFT